MENQWQLCPKCHGQGAVSKPPGLAGDINEWTSSQTSFQCDLCHGKKVIAPPLFDNWVSVDDKSKPEFGKAILMYFNNGAIFCGYRSSENSGENEWVVYSDEFSLEKEGPVMTHWAPLPAPPLNNGSIIKNPKRETSNP